MKCVMIVDSDLPIGIQVNTAAVLGVSLASEIKGLTGKKLIDKDGILHEGVINIPIPILTLSSEEIKQKYDQLLKIDDNEIRVIGFNDVAQKSLEYDDYEMKLAQTNNNTINYLGICIYGPKKKVNKLTGNIKMLR
ncbi:DUF2000 domain-containing protein [Clostridium magnum]|uniref:DUF2000 domain-containing protein n=1 Tax=Clostridium magnum DSM 2767 TaxID=1121326 RepID=A0A162TC05_9CLOT|nr:DUF2000 domain-containing protein [Clostridium magnum]KZL92451.1 hypothetical protein CLMAG_22600 [Clostridium magnum DSM 2767]SHI26662.1 Protein of unknown function [Clostridium magnum DSM 2767]